MSALCPSPHNELGKHIFSPEQETKLLAAGYVFACRITTKRVSGLVRCKRPIADAVRDMELDNPYSSSLLSDRAGAPTAPVPQLVP